MFRDVDARSAGGEYALLSGTLGNGERVLVHHELLGVELLLPIPGQEERQRIEPVVVVGQLVVSKIDEFAVYVRWEDPYTLHASGDAGDLAPEDDVVLAAAVRDAPQVVTSWFLKPDRLLDFIGNRRVVIETFNLQRFDWPVPGWVQADDSTPSADLIEALQSHLINDGWAKNGSGTFFRLVNATTAMRAAVSPKSFLMERPNARRPITVQLGISRSDINQYNSWFSGLDGDPWRWTMQEQASFFASGVPHTWGPDAAADTLITNVAAAIDGLSTLCEPASLRDYLWADRNAIHTALYRQARLAEAALTGWSERAERDLAEWAGTTVSRNLHTVFSATVREYLASNKPAYWINPNPAVIHGKKP